MSEKIIELIFGKRGSGKSYLAKYLALQHIRIIVYDTLCEYKDGAICEQYDMFCRVWKNCYLNNFRLIYQPVDPENEFEKIAELVYECGNLCFLIEEIDCFTPAQGICLPFKSIIQRGRHKDISVIGITQRPHGISRLLTSQAKKMYIFNTTEPRDLEYFSQVLGDSVVKKISELKLYEFVEWSEATDELLIRKI